MTNLLLGISMLISGGSCDITPDNSTSYNIIKVVKTVAPEKFIKKYKPNELNRVANIISQYGREHGGLNPINVLTLAHLESSFNPKAYNKNRNGTNDRGLFQHNSKYWSSRYKSAKKYICKSKEFDKWCSVMKQDRNDPETNTIVTIYHLLFLKNHYNLNGDNIFRAHHGVAYALNHKKKAGKKYMKVFNKRRNLIRKHWRK